MKLKLNLIFFLLFPVLYYTQTPNLKFDKKYFECEDMWVAFPKSNSDTAYSYGFIYLDEEAGFTFNFESKFKVTDDGEFYKTKKDTSWNIKMRLSPETKPVAIIPSDKIAELELPPDPEWLRFYKQSSDSLNSLIRRGYHYNHVGASELALNDLEKAYQISKHAEQLEFELAFAYNATKRFEKAEEILRLAIESDPNNLFYYRELGYSLIGQNKFEEAEMIYLKGIKLSNDKFQQSEMAVNMAQVYFKQKDKRKFREWAKLTKKYADKDSDYLMYINYWEKEMNK